MAKDQRVLFEAFPPKCTRMPKVIGPSSIQGLSRQDALRYGLLVTLDRDVIFTKGKGVLGTTANKGSDVMFFVATPPSQAGVTACYRRVRHSIEPLSDPPGFKNWPRGLEWLECWKLPDLREPFGISFLIFSRSGWIMLD